MSFGCQGDVQIYCGESLGQKIFMFLRSDRALFCWSSSFKYLLALIVVRMNTNIFNQTIISCVLCSSIKQSSLVVQFHIFYFNLSARLSVSLLSRCSIKKPVQVSTLEEFDRWKVDFTIIISVAIIIIIIHNLIIIISSSRGGVFREGELLVPKKKRKPQQWID